MVRPASPPSRSTRTVEAFIVSRGASSAFKGYRATPPPSASRSTRRFVHGIPSAKRKLREGDIVGLEPRLYRGRVLRGQRDHPAGGRGGSAGPGAARRHPREPGQGHRPVPPGQPDRRRLSRGADPLREPRVRGGACVRGHGIGQSLHEDPQVPNFGEAGTGKP
jgi:methionyl aminopeptidase